MRFLLSLLLAVFLVSASGCGGSSYKDRELPAGYDENADPMKTVGDQMKNPAGSKPAAPKK